MIKIIKTQFQDVGKGWFNMKETSTTTYDFGKLKRFLTLVRLMMQDTLTYIVQTNYTKYEEYMLSYIPDETIITSSNDVKNVWHKNDKERAEGKKVKDPHALF